MNCIHCPSKCNLGCEEDNNYEIVCSIKCVENEFIYDDETCKVGCNVSNGFYSIAAGNN